jgi:hypothetical protein
LPGRKAFVLLKDAPQQGQRKEMAGIGRSPRIGVIFAHGTDRDKTRLVDEMACEIMAAVSFTVGIERFAGDPAGSNASLPAEGRTITTSAAPSAAAD